MRVLLINPPLTGGVYLDRRQRCTGDVPSGWTHPPIGQAYIASAVDKWNQCTTRIIDCVAFNMTKEVFIEDAVQWKPDVLVSVVGAYSFPSDLSVLSEVKKRTGAVIAVYGEIVSAICGQLATEYPDIDFYVRGDPEWPVSKIIEHKRGNCKIGDIPAVTYKTDGAVRENVTPSYPHLDTLPFPDRSLITNHAYKCMPFINGGFTDLVTSRGCPAKCTFCTTQKFWGPKNRDRTADNVNAEVEEIVFKYKIKNLFITDETFTLDKKRIRNILPQWKKWGVKFAMQTRVDCVNDDLIRQLADSGCIYIHYGLESASQRILDYYKKGQRVHKVEEIVKATRKAGIPVHGTFILGNDIETPEEIESTIKFAKKLDLDFYHFGPMIPFPLSAVYNKLDEEGKLLHKDFSKYKKPNIVYKMENLTEQQVNDYLRLAYKEVILTPRYAFKKFIWLVKSGNGWKGIKEMAVGSFWVLWTFFKGRKKEALQEQGEQDTAHFQPVHQNTNEAETPVENTGRAK